MIKLAAPEIHTLCYVENAILPGASICYDLPADDKERVIRIIDNKKHFAILRHGFASVMISGISRVIGRQILRKAHADYLEMSQRYVDVSNARFIMPKKISEDATQRIIFENGVKASKKSYIALRKSGSTKEDARYVLSQAIETKLVMSGTLQTWWDFFNLRISDRVQHECRITAERILLDFAGRSNIFMHHPKFLQLTSEAV